MWLLLDAWNGIVWLQQGIFLKGKEAGIVTPALIKIWAFYLKDSLNKNSSPLLEVEMLHLDVSLVYTSPLSAPANAVQHVTGLSHHKTYAQFDISQAPWPGRAAAYPVHPQPVSVQGVTPSSSRICAFLFAVMLCWVLQPTKALPNAAQFSILRDIGTVCANLSSWKGNSFSFPYLFSTVFYRSHYQSYTNVKFTTCLSIFFKKSYVKTLPSCPGIYVVKDRWWHHHLFPPICCWYPQTVTWKKSWMVVHS